MRTLQHELLRLQRIVTTGVISEDEYQQVITERRGRTLTARGNLAIKRKSQPTAFDSGQPASLGVQRSISRSVKPWDGKAAPEVQLRDMQIKWNAKSHVKVIKRTVAVEPSTA
jgi:hypothetical protein